MSKYVRVRVKENGHHWTVLAEEFKNNSDAYELLKQPAVNECGDPLPGEIPAETNGQSAAVIKKES